MKRLVVLGGGESGYGSAVLAKKMGLDVFVSDMGVIAPKYRDILEQWHVDYEQQKHTEELILSADEIVKSPGIPDMAPIVVEAVSRGIPVISEIEFATQYTDAKTICITGSNGKTTTTTLIYKILKEAGYNVGLGGNIGESFAYSVATKSYDWYVLELSSFQLDGMYGFKADIALLMNITPDHLDRYNYEMQNYVNSKMRIVQNQGVEDSFIYCADDTIITKEYLSLKYDGSVFPFSLNSDLEQGASLVDGELVCRVAGKELRCRCGSLRIKGQHNLYNAMASSMAAMIAGVPHQAILDSLWSFGGVEHRLESVAVRNGVEYINDSKATNVDSVWYALEGMTKPVVWIAGGTDKGNDYSPLIPLIKGRVKALVCMGLDNGKLMRSFEGVVDTIVDTNSLEDAMTCASKLAKEGDVVLLSPACASFDLFRNYEDRGEKFKKWVNVKLN